MIKKLLLSSKGMTLVETLVAGIIGTVLAGSIVIIYIMFNNQLKENNANLVLQMQYENLSEQIAFNARRAHKILNGSSAYYDTCDIYGDSVSNVRFYNTAGRQFAGVGIFNDTVKEIDSATNQWIPFKTGNGTIKARSARSFFLNGCKNSISLNLNLTFRGNDSTYFLTVRKDEFLCRN
jgi:type II secretory pathway pseudopilin PulG